MVSKSRMRRQVNTSRFHYCQVILVKLTRENQENGMAGCIIFTDPGDDGEVTVKNGYLAYPGISLQFSFKLSLWPY